LFAVETGDESPTAYLAPCFERPEDADQVTPRTGLFFAQDRAPKNDPGASKELASHGLDGETLGRFVKKQAPAPGHGNAGVAP
jgi:hypothetical protein